MATAPYFTWYGVSGNRNVSTRSATLKFGSYTLHRTAETVYAFVAIAEGDSSAYSPLSEVNRCYFNVGDGEVDLTFLQSWDIWSGRGKMYLYAYPYGDSTSVKTGTITATCTGINETMHIQALVFAHTYQGNQDYLIKDYLLQTDSGDTMPWDQSPATITMSHLPADGAILCMHYIVWSRSGGSQEVSAYNSTKIAQSNAYTRDAGGTIEFLTYLNSIYKLNGTSSTVTLGAQSVHNLTINAPYNIFSIYIANNDWEGPFVPPWTPGDTINVACGYVGQVVSSSPDLTHLEGQTVAILANGNVMSEQVVTGGEISISSTFSLVHIGLPFYSDLETLNIEVPTNEGTIQSKRQKINNVTFRLKDSRGGYIGPDDSDLWNAFTPQAIRESSGQNISDLEIFTGDIRQPLGGQYGDSGHVFYRQVDPLPITIGAVIPEVDIAKQSR